MRGFVASLICSLALAGCGTVGSGDAPPGSPEALQKQRLDYINQLVEDEIIVKTGTISPTLAEVFVDGAWYFVSRPRQETYANVIFTYWKNEFPEMEVLALKDGFDGTEVGKFDLDFGLQLDR
jgi:hypothetical protein